LIEHNKRPYTRRTEGIQVVQTMNSTIELENFLTDNMDFYTEEWIKYLKNNKWDWNGIDPLI
jgi:hypothetical protein